MGGGEGGQGHLVGLWVPLKKILATPLNSEPKKNMMKKNIPQTIAIAAIYRLLFLGSVFLCLREDLKENQVDSGTFAFP